MIDAEKNEEDEQENKCRTTSLENNKEEECNHCHYYPTFLLVKGKTIRFIKKKYAPENVEMNTFLLRDVPIICKTKISDLFSNDIS